MTHAAGCGGRSVPVLGRGLTLTQIEIAICLFRAVRWYFDQFQLWAQPEFREAGLHVRRWLYHLFFALIEEEPARAEEPGVSDELARAWRDWRAFCGDDANHFLFPPPGKTDELGLRGVEAEVTAMVERTDCRWFRPWRFWRVFGPRGGRDRTEHPTGIPAAPRFPPGDLVGFLIATWVLPKRYDWLRAARWAFRQVGQALAAGDPRAWLSLLAVGAALSTPFWLPQWLRPVGAVQPAIALVYGVAAALGAAACVSRVFLDLFLPRMWAGIGVGYLALLLSGDAWKAAGGIVDWQVAAGLWAGNGVVSLMYFQWEISARLRRTRGVGRSLPLGRAAVLTLLGGVISLLLGTLLLDIMTLRMWAMLQPGVHLPWLVRGIFGWVPGHVLLVYAPVAMTLGVLLQVFWEEKSVAHPLE
ncbi:MAG: hypothetical protein ACO1SX_08460 [Actinomycetota bacterium]